MTAKKNNQNQKLHNTRSATKTTKKSTKQHIMDNINAENKTIEPSLRSFSIVLFSTLMLKTKLLKSSSTTVLPANVKSKNNKNVKHNASRKKPKPLSTDNNEQNIV